MSGDPTMIVYHIYHGKSQLQVLKSIMIFILIESSVFSPQEGRKVWAVNKNFQKKKILMGSSALPSTYTF